jgi:hypothetical protein
MRPYNSTQLIGRPADVGGGTYSSPPTPHLRRRLKLLFATQSYSRYDTMPSK